MMKQRTAIPTLGCAAGPGGGDFNHYPLFSLLVILIHWVDHPFVLSEKEKGLVGGCKPSQSMVP